MKRNIFITLLIFLSVILFLLFSVKGHKGNPIYYQTEKNINVGGPFESSNTTSRYALIEAIVNNKTFSLNEEQAKFAAGDLVYYNNKFFSIFTPGVSFVGVPFYMLGKIFGLPQLFTFFSTLVFTICNVYLITKIGEKLGADKYGALLGGMIFLFGTNAFAYSLTLTQHHVSTFFILLSILNALLRRSWINNLILGITFSAAILMDIPNAFMIFPVILYVFVKHFYIKELGEKVRLSFKLNSILFVIGIIPLFALFGWYNYSLTGSYTKVSQTIGRIDYLESGKLREREVERKQKNPYDTKQVYNPRDQLNGLYVLIISNERGWMYYSPVILVGILGLILAYNKKENQNLVVLNCAVILVCLLTYSMFGDPWGGWSFGPRYLIPASALVCMGIGVAIQKYKKNPLFILIFLLLTSYSIAVNALGAMTTSAIPPKVEAQNLSEPIPYTYEYNLKFVEQNRSSSLVYNLFFYRYSSFQQFLLSFIALEIVFIVVLYVFSITRVRGAEI